MYFTNVLSRTRCKKFRYTFYFQNKHSFKEFIFCRVQKIKNGLKINSLETWPKSLTHVTPDGLDITDVIKIDFIEAFVCSGGFYFWFLLFLSPKGPSIKDVCIKGGGGGSAKCRQLQTEGRGVVETALLIRIFSDGKNVLSWYDTFAGYVGK